MRLVTIACFLNEEAYLPIFLSSLAGQTRPPDRLLLVDDGSTDRSLELARAFASEHSYARVLERPRRPKQRDRLATAAELEAFSWGVSNVDGDWDVIAKLDADIDFSPHSFADVIAHLEADPRLGLTGPRLVMPGPDGQMLTERSWPDHVRGAMKFYRRECFEQVYPLPPRLGWDTLDEIRAQMHGWRTGSFPASDRDPVHLRPTGSQDGAARGFRREGMASYGYGTGAGWMLLGAARRMRQRPTTLWGPAFMAGWLTAAVRRAPRASRQERAYLLTRQRARLRNSLARAPRPS
ncbi:MAG: glycosyltransferase family 2 protein [Solirubrobacteraceae bacterium]